MKPASKFETSSLPRVQQVISKNREAKASRIIDIPLEKSSSLTRFDEKADVFVYGTFKVQESGYYSISNQCCVSVPSKVEVNVFQHGLCVADYSDFGSSLNSSVLNTTTQDETILTSNLSTFKHLEEGVTYILWLNITASKLASIRYLEEYSHLLLIKM